MLIKRECEICGKRFQYYDTQAHAGRFCSFKCYGKWKGKPKQEYICPSCQKKFWKYPSLGGKTKCCSRKCMGIWRSKTFIGEQNPAFGKKRPDLSEFNKKTKSELMRTRNPMHNTDYVKKISGEKHYNWKGGKPSSNYLARNKGEGKRFYRRWRNAILKRDNYTCQICSSQKNLEGAHIKSFAKYPELRFDINNGRVLCNKCHSLTDKHRYLKKEK